MASEPRPSRLPRALRAWFLPVWQIVEGLRQHYAFSVAASVAFWFFLSLIPLLVFGGWVLGQFVRSRGVEALTEPLMTLVPVAAHRLLQKELVRLAGASSAPLGPLSVVGFLWTASSGFHNLMDVFEIVQQSLRRPWYRQRLYALGWLLVLLSLGTALSWLFFRASFVFEHGVLRGAKGGPPFSVWVLVSLTAISFLAALYRFGVAHKAAISRRAFPGAISAFVLWVSVSWVFGKIVQSLDSYAVYYGSLAAVAILLIWLYITSVIVLIGSEVNARLEGIRGRVGRLSLVGR